MVNTSSAKARSNCLIVYGWSEGRWHSKKMRKLLAEQGFGVTEDAGEADIVIAHSMGCYLVPPTPKAKVILMIGLPYWPGRPMPLSVALNTVKNIRSSLGDGSTWWLSKLLHNCWYILAKPAATYYAMTRRKLSRLPSAGASRHIMLVRNADDMFCHPGIAKLLPVDLNYKYVDVDEKLHEDCWLNPAPYVKLVEKYHG